MALPASSARPSTVGFLHLSEDVRNKIYQLAIFDHDRAAVFLPRAYPRKVEPGVDDVDIFWTHSRGPCAFDGPPLPQNYQVTAVNPEGTAASGRWVKVKDLHASSLRLIGHRDNLDDDDILKILDQEDARKAHEDEELDSDNEYSASESSNPDSDVVHVDRPDETTDTSGNGDDDTCCSCACHNPDQDENEAESESGISDDEQETDTFENSSWNAKSVRTHEAEGNGGNAKKPCDSCVSLECAMPSSTEADDLILDPAFRYISSTLNVFRAGESVDVDDHEHFDAEEKIGMLYEPKEPGILLASKQVRAECLQVYYGSNAFSWRFPWLQYASSCKRFKSWVQSIDSDNIKLVTKISFEGRHVIEEGVELSIDIDLFDTEPYFEATVHGDQSLDGDIAKDLNHDTTGYLRLMAQRDDGRPRLSVTHVCNLASIFVQAMHRDANRCLDEGAEDWQSVLNPPSQP